MRGSRWKPLPASLPSPAREFAQRLRASLDRSGLSLRRLAADDEVHYSVTALHRFFSGQALPPRQLVDVLAKRCGDADGLHELYERARVAVGEAAPGTPDSGAAARDRRPAPRRGRLRRLVLRHRMNLVGTVLFAAGVIVGIAFDPEVFNRQEPNPAVASSGAAGVQLVRNGSFATTVQPWWETSGIRLEIRQSQLWAHVPGGTPDVWLRIIGHSGIRLTAGQHYTLSFDAAACEERKGRVTVQMEFEPHEEALGNPISLNTRWQHMSFGFTSPISTDRGTVQFHLGGHPNDCWFRFDNVSLVHSN
jgi:Carbohydrate binding domain